MNNTNSKGARRVVVYLSNKEFENYQELRAKLIIQGTNFSAWMRDKIIKEGGAKK